MKVECPKGMQLGYFYLFVNFKFTYKKNYAYKQETETVE